jgi:predicted CopG family antitoxin
VSHQVRLDDDVYEHIKSRKRDEETFSEAIERLTSEWTLLDFAEGAPVVDAETHREALEQSEKQDIEETRDRLERLGLSVDE